MLNVLCEYQCPFDDCVVIICKIRGQHLNQEVLSTQDLTRNKNYRTGSAARLPMHVLLDSGEFGVVIQMAKVRFMFGLWFGLFSEKSQNGTQKIHIGLL